MLDQHTSALVAVSLRVSKQQQISHPVLDDEILGAPRLLFSASGERQHQRTETQETAA